MPSAEPGSVAPRTSSTSSSTYGNTTVKYTTWRPILALHPRPHRRHRHRSKIQRCGIPKKGKTKLFFPRTPSWASTFNSIGPWWRHRPVLAMTSSSFLLARIVTGAPGPSNQRATIEKPQRKGKQTRKQTKWWRCWLCLSSGRPSRCKSRRWSRRRPARPPAPSAGRRSPPLRRRSSARAV